MCRSYLLCLLAPVAVVLKNWDRGLEFEALPLNFDENFAFVGSNNVDFIYSNPAAYLCMAVEFEVQTVASLVNYRKGYALSKFAGVAELTGCLWLFKRLQIQAEWQLHP